MKRKYIACTLILLAALSAALLAGGCDHYDEVPPRNDNVSYDLLPIVGESPSAADLEAWRAIRAEYEAAVGK